jgi:uncharacterized protein
MNAIPSTQLLGPGSESRVPMSSGREIDLLRLDANDVEAHDIAHALAYEAFHAGLTERFYSSAQHAIEVARRVSPRYRLAALLHRAPAAYMGDMTRIRDLFPELRYFEERVRRAIHHRFGLPERLSPEVLEAVQEAEAKVIAIEEYELFIPPPPEEGAPPLPRPTVTQIRPLSPERAEQAYKAFLEIEAR